MNNMSDLLLLVYALSISIPIVFAICAGAYYYAKSKYESHMAQVDAEAAMSETYAQGYSNTLAGKENAFAAWISSNMSLSIEKVEEGRRRFDEMYRAGDNN